MNTTTRQRLLDLNRQFYASVADDFDVTRLNVPMGMVRVLNYVRPLIREGETTGWRGGEKDPSPITVLDAGCGNGRFCWALEQLETPIDYLGIDADEKLLAHARQHTASLKYVYANFANFDLTKPVIPYSASIRYTEDKLRTSHFDVVTCFAVLHHMPGYDLRLQIVRWLADLLHPTGVLLLSTWQFLNSPRLVAKQLDWSTVGVDPSEIEAGDLLLPWNQGTFAIRYAHQIDEDELRQLAADSDLDLQEIYYADGKEGNLNLYGVLRKKPPASI